MGQWQILIEILSGISIASVLKEHIFSIRRQNKAIVKSLETGLVFASWTAFSGGRWPYEELGGKTNRKIECLVGSSEVTFQEYFKFPAAKKTRNPTCQRAICSWDDQALLKSLMFIIMHPHSKGIPHPSVPAVDALLYRKNLNCKTWEASASVEIWEHCLFPPFLNVKYFNKSIVAQYIWNVWCYAGWISKKKI